MDSCDWDAVVRRVLATFRGEGFPGWEAARNAAYGRMEARLAAAADDFAGRLAP